MDAIDDILHRQCRREAQRQCLQDVVGLLPGSANMVPRIEAWVVGDLKETDVEDLPRRMLASLALARRR